MPRLPPRSLCAWRTPGARQERGRTHRDALHRRDEAARTRVDACRVVQRLRARAAPADRLELHVVARRVVAVHDVRPRRKVVRVGEGLRPSPAGARQRRRRGGFERRYVEARQHRLAPSARAGRAAGKGDGAGGNDARHRRHRRLVPARPRPPAAPRAAGTTLAIPTAGEVTVRCSSSSTASTRLLGLRECGSFVESDG